MMVQGKPHIYRVMLLGGGWVWRCFSVSRQHGPKWGYGTTPTAAFRAYEMSA